MSFLYCEQIALRLLSNPGRALDTCKFATCGWMAVLGLKAELDDMLSSQPGDQLPWRTLGDDFSMVHNRYPVTQLLGLIHIMGREQDRSSLLLQIVHYIPQLATTLGVQTCRGFVQEKDFWVSHQGHRYRQSLTLTARELTHPG